MSVCSFVQSQSAPSSSQTPSSSSQSSNLSTLNEKPILTLKTSPKQVLMLNSNRVSLSPGSQTSDQTYNSKKSPTILILSKPKSELSHKSLVHKPPKSSSNLISSYFNKQNSISGSNTTSISPNVQNHSHHLSNLPIQFMPNSKPITLIPIGKLASNSNASNFNDNSFNSLIPIETIEISTATIEINSTNESSTEVKREKVEPIESKVELPVEPQEKQETIVEHKEQKVEPISYKIDVTRCICEMDHDDGFMICCDSCLVWQHIACMEVNKKKIPDKFYCEKCNPRAVNAQRARQIQEKYLKNLSKNLNKLKSRRHSNSSSAALTPIGENESIDETIDNEANVLSPAGSDNAESRKNKKRLKSRTIREEFEVKKPDDADRDSADKLNAFDIGSLNLAPNSNDLLKLAKVKCSKKSEEIEETKYRVKLTQALQKDRIVCEYVGQVSLNTESETHTECFNYTFKVPISGESKPSTSTSSSSSTANLVDLESIQISIDSSKVFNNSRYIRKSCQANSKLVPVKDTCGNLKFFIQTTESIGKNSEIFLSPDLNNLNNSICLCEAVECELRHKVSTKSAKKLVQKKPERRLSANSPPPSHDDSFKCLSREDRKLASYVRVIEKLEKQVKRKKETKSRDNSEKCDAEKCPKETSEKENEKNKKCRTSRPSLLSKHEQAVEPVDQEIASINEKPALDEEPKPSVKSPDYSFVNLSIQPRHTLNLLKRNLAAADDRFSPALEPLENNQTFLTNKSFFHPKKHWLKTCCSNEDNQVDLSPSKSESSQPPKKRRFVVEQTSSESNSLQQNEPNESIQQQTPPLFGPDQFYLNYMQSPIINSSFFAPNPIFNTFNPYAAFSMYQNFLPVIGQPSVPESQPEKKKVSLAEYRQRKECVKLTDAMFESISSSKSCSNDDSLCELDVYPTEGKDSPDSPCSSCSSRRTRNASLSNISDVSSVRSRSPSNSSQRSHTSKFDITYQKAIKRKHRSRSASRLFEQELNVIKHKKRSSSLNRPSKICQIDNKCVNSKSLSKSYGSCSSSSSIFSSIDVSSVAKTQL